MRFKTNWLQSCFNFVQNSQLSVKSEATDGDIQKKKKRYLSSIARVFLKKLLKWMKPFIADQGNY